MNKYALIDLHLHLDGSLSIKDMLEMNQIQPIALPTKDPQLLKEFVSCPLDCKDLNEYLNCFVIPDALMQSKETIALAVSSLIQRLDGQGLIYAEIRFAPQLHLEKGLSQEDVVKAAIAGLKEGLSKTKMHAQLILCAMRGDDNEGANRETVRLTKRYLHQGVCALDLAGAEALYATHTFENLFHYAASLDVPYTIHAGEADHMTSIKDAIDFGAKRIGHGIRSYQDSKGKQLIKKHHVTLELCPTSNLNTQAVRAIDTYEKYPLGDFIKEGLLVTLNTDNMTVSNTTLSQEFDHMLAAHVIDETMAKQLVFNAIEAAFLTAKEKEVLKKKALLKMNQ